MSRKNRARESGPPSRKLLCAGGLPGSWTGLTALLIVALALSVSALQNPAQSPDPQTGARDAGVKPKRPQRRDKSRKGAKSSLSSTNPETGAAATQGLSPILAAADFDLMGLAVTAGPASL